MILITLRYMISTTFITLKHQVLSLGSSIYIHHIYSMPNEISTDLFESLRLEESETSSMDLDYDSDHRSVCDVEMEDLPTLEKEEEPSLISTVSRALVSPTIAGAELATSPKWNSDKVKDEMKQVELYKPPVTVEEQNVARQTEFVVEGNHGRTPVQLQVHHHHYYFNNESPRNPSTEPPRVHLPNPWEETSAPSSKAPYALASYLQMLINILATVYGASVVYQMVQTVKLDISHKTEQIISDLIVEQNICRKKFIENDCSPDKIVPALERKCAEWEKCMRRDPFASGGYSSQGAEMFGVILNSVFEPISLRSLGLLLCVAFGVVGVNFSFGFLRAKSYYGWKDKEE